MVERPSLRVCTQTGWRVESQRRRPMDGGVGGVGEERVCPSIRERGQLINNSKDIILYIISVN